MLKKQTKVMAIGIFVGAILFTAYKIWDNNAKRAAAAAKRRQNACYKNPAFDCIKDCECGYGDCCNSCSLFKADDEFDKILREDPDYIS